MSNNSPNLPAAPNLSKQYQKGIDVYLQNLGSQLNAEDTARAGQDPGRIVEQQNLQSDYGPRQYQEILSAFNQLDPTYAAAHAALGKGVVDQYNLGTSIPPSEATALTQQIRGAQAARGNSYGDAPAIEEAYTLGDRGLQLQQQRTANLAGFLAQPTIPQLAASVPPVQADRSYGYTNANAGYLGAQYALSNYQNQVAAAGGQTNPWASALQGGLQGAQIGAQFGGGYGALIGGVGGAISGGTGFSDPAIKTNVTKVGKTKFGLNQYEFNFKTPRFRGVMADEVEKVAPGAVSVDPQTGFKKVDYGKLGLKMERVA